MSLSQRIENGLFEIVKTHVFLLSLFVIMYTYNFAEQESVSALIEAGMIEDPSQISDPLVKFYIGNQQYILMTLIGTPTIALLALKMKNNLPNATAKPETLTLLLQKDLAEEHVEHSDHSLTIHFSGLSGWKGNLVVTKPCKAIHVKAQFVGSGLDVYLYRNDKYVCR